MIYVYYNILCTLLQLRRNNSKYLQLKALSPIAFSLYKASLDNFWQGLVIRAFSLIDWIEIVESNLE